MYPKTYVIYNHACHSTQQGAIDNEVATVINLQSRREEILAKMVFNACSPESPEMDFDERNMVMELLDKDVVLS